MFGIPLEFVVIVGVVLLLALDILVAVKYDEMIEILKAMFFTKKD